MTCQDLKSLIENTLPGQRSVTALAEAYQHASACPSCATALVDMFRLEEELTRLTGVAGDDQLIPSVMSRIAALSPRPAGNGTLQDWSAVIFMTVGALILLAAYWWTGAWSDALARSFDISPGWVSSVLTANAWALQMETLLPALAGAALIAIGLMRESPSSFSNSSFQNQPVYL
jgi:hypothetical protein